MNTLEEATKVAALLGEANEQRLKDAITDALIRAAEKNIADFFEEYYAMDFDDMFAEIEEEVKAAAKKKILKRVKAEPEKGT